MLTSTPEVNYKIRLNLGNVKMPSLNQWIKWFWKKKSNFKNDLARFLWGLLLNELGTLDIIQNKEEKKKITMYRYYDGYRHRKYDHDNFIGGCSKPLMDAFVNLEIIKNDSSEYLIHGEHKQIKDKKNPRFEVEIEW
jgi:hypothetical protein